MSLEDALALAGVTEEGLYLALAEQYDPELAQEVPGADLCIQDPDLRASAWVGTAKPLFYLHRPLRRPGGQRGGRRQRGGAPLYLVRWDLHPL